MGLESNIKLGAHLRTQSSTFCFLYLKCKKGCAFGVTWRQTSSTFVTIEVKVAILCVTRHTK